jgi:hypothetical protein
MMLLLSVLVAWRVTCSPAGAELEARIQTWSLASANNDAASLLSDNGVCSTILKSDDDALAPRTAPAHLQCADLASSEQLISSYFGAEHYLAFDPGVLGIPALGYRMFSDRNLDLHHGEGLWLQMLQLSAGGQPDAAIAASAASPTSLPAYRWRPDFVEQVGTLRSTNGVAIKIDQRVYYSDVNTIEADFAIQSNGPTAMHLTGRPNPANTFITMHKLGWRNGALQLGVVLKTNLTHAAGGTAAGCIAAGICEPLTLRAVVSISCSNHRDDCNLSVTSVCGSPPPPPVGAQCELTKQVSHLLCVKNKTFGCYSNGTMWTSDINGARCMGIFDCAGVSAVDCPGTGTVIGQRTQCQCLPPPPQQSCNFTFALPLDAQRPSALHATIEFVTEAEFSALLLRSGSTHEDSDARHSPPDATRGLNRTTVAINAWLAAAAPLPTGSDLDSRGRTMYYRSWLNYWEMVYLGRGNWSGRPVISSSKTSYGRSPRCAAYALWDQAFHIMGLLRGGPAALALARAQAMEFVTCSKTGLNTSTLPGVMSWAALQLYERTQDRDLLAQIYAASAKSNRYFWQNFDKDRNGLCEWSSLVSGWDNSPRWSEGPVEAVDLNAWLVLDAQKLAGMANLLGRPSAEIDTWWWSANVTAALMQQRLWDEETGVFFDLNPRTNASVKVITPATFFALLPGVATKVQAERMAMQLTNASSLRTPFPIPVVSRSDPTYAPATYWRGPTWININYLVVVGLRRYGLTALATQIRRETLALVARGDVLREYYDSINGTGLGAENFMWTGALFVVLALESGEPAIAPPPPPPTLAPAAASSLPITVTVDPVRGVDDADHATNRWVSDSWERGTSRGFLGASSRGTLKTDDGCWVVPLSPPPLPSLLQLC